MTSPSITHPQLLILGSGFGGALLALFARKLGLTVLVLEKSQHPRFAIGESSTPLTNLLLEELFTRYQCPHLLPLTQYGTWLKQYPEVGVGLKRGFTFYFHPSPDSSSNHQTKLQELLVAASPNDFLADTHWYRPEFDHLLIREAVQAGAILMENCDIQSIQASSSHLTLDIRHKGHLLTLQPEFIVDASGAQGALARHLRLPPAPLKHIPPTAALYAHFKNVLPCNQERSHPYPSEASAVHHITPDGWIWILRFNNGIVSAGAALKPDAYRNLTAPSPQAKWNTFLRGYPEIQNQFAQATPVTPFFETPSLPFRQTQIIGPQWALLPSAAGFIDPLLSTGFALNLFGIQRLLNIFETSWPPTPDRLEQYADLTQSELDLTESLIGALYQNLASPQTFTALSFLYFAAASYTETVRRLGKPHLAPGFLLHQHPHWSPKIKHAIDLLNASPNNPLQKALEIIEPFNVIGLGNPQRHPYYPADLNDLFAAASKLQATPQELHTLINSLNRNMTQRD